MQRYYNCARNRKKTKYDTPLVQLRLYALSLVYAYINMKASSYRPVIYGLVSHKRVETIVQHK